MYLFLLSLAFNVVIGAAGRETLAGIFSGMPVVGELAAAFVTSQRHINGWKIIAKQLKAYHTQQKVKWKIQSDS